MALSGVPREPLPVSNGTFEILQATRIVEEAGICCCVAGTGVDLLRYRKDPWYKLDNTVSLLQKSPRYLAASPSVAHTSPRFKHHDVRLYFVLVPSTDCSLPCTPSSINKCLKTSLPYPKLDVYIQSLLECHNAVDLCDAVDGSNVPEEWGYNHLDLDGQADLKWLHLKNKAITDDLV